MDDLCCPARMRPSLKDFSKRIAGTLTRSAGMAWVLRSAATCRGIGSACWPGIISYATARTCGSYVSAGRAGAGRGAQADSGPPNDQCLPLSWRAPCRSGESLKHQEKLHVPELDPGYYGLTDADMNTVYGTGSLVGPPRSPLSEILRTLRQTYCGTVGVEYMYITDTEQKRWIQNRLEGSRAQPAYSAEYKMHILERLNAAEGVRKSICIRAMSARNASLAKAARV